MGYPPIPRGGGIYTSSPPILPVSEVKQAKTSLILPVSGCKTGLKPPLFFREGGRTVVNSLLPGCVGTVRNSTETRYRECCFTRNLPSETPVSLLGIPASVINTVNTLLTLGI